MERIEHLVRRSIRLESRRPEESASQERQGRWLGAHARRRLVGAPATVGRSWVVMAAKALRG